MRRFACLAAALLAATPALAQPLRSIVVPADAAVAIPPRGQPWPAPAPPIGIVQSLPVIPAPTTTIPLAAAPMGLGAVAPLIIPLAVAALLGGSLAGGGSGGSAPATTR